MGMGYLNTDRCKSFFHALFDRSHSLIDALLHLAPLTAQSVHFTAQADHFAAQPSDFSSELLKLRRDDVWDRLLYGVVCPLESHRLNSITLRLEAKAADSSAGRFRPSGTDRSRGRLRGRPRSPTPPATGRGVRRQPRTRPARCS